MAEDRKIFPLGQVLELVTGKNGADTSAIVSFITGRSNPGPETLKAAAPFAFAWLARWYPKFMDMEWKEDQTWEAYLRQASHLLGENVSIVPMSGRLKAAADAALNAIEDSQKELARQMETVGKLEKEVGSLKPLQGLLDAASKKNDDLEAKMKAMKSEMMALNRKALEFEGKIPMDQEELAQTIKDAIKDGLKGMAVGVAAAAATAPETVAESAQPEGASSEDEWGFGPSDNSGEFGF